MDINVASINYYVNLSIFFTSHHVVNMNLLRVSYLSGNELKTLRLNSFIYKREANNKTSHKAIVMIK